MLKISKLDINLPLELVKTCAALADSQLCKFVATNEEGEFQHSIEVKNKEDGVISLELSNLEIGYESGRFVAQIMKVFQVFQGTIGAPQNYTSQHDLSQDSALKPPADGAVQTGWAGVKAGHPTSSSFVDLTESSEKRIVSDKDTNSHRSIQTIPTPITIQDNAKLENRFNEVGNNSRTSEGEASSTVSPVHLYKNLCSKRPASSSIKGQETMPLKRPCTLPQASDTITEVDIHETPESHGEDSQSNDNKDIALNTKLICSIQDTVEVKQELVDIDIGSVMQHVDVPAGFESSVSSNQPMWSMQPREHSNLPPMIPTWQHSLDGSHSQDMPSTSVQPAARGKNIIETLSADAQNKEGSHKKSVLWKCVKSILGHYGPIVYVRPIQQSLRVRADELKDCMIQMEAEGLGKYLQVGSRGSSIFVKKHPQDDITWCQKYDISTDIYMKRYYTCDSYIVKTLTPNAKWQLIEKCRYEVGEKYGNVIEELYSPKAPGLDCEDQNENV
ncbi:uncharacterized protein LOC106157998 isoform X4 [Lingula anatina]|uniref:Uncharacterized protein LOC106157998 isoform X4 n=1 Tax=Lingula anatina TaxID=7574 RepID=A0A1S3HTC0_LINAN|nr:uncharacterized protein LOC106157998 isoform X4 [Lingula anatina]|eukprot:XP_013389282.1 uncharacterized protein LOC106157998 isoform X4 [Lingula anatina]